MTKLHEHIESSQAPHDLPDAVVLYLTAWRNDETFETIQHPTWSTLTQKIIDEQDTIGWDLLLEGCISKSWQGTIARYLISLNSKKTPLRWVSALIRKLWEVSWDMWDDRNQALHQEGENEKLKGILELNRKIAFEKELGIDALMFSDEKALFSKDTEIIQNMPLQHKEAWLDKVEKARLSCTFRNQSFMPSER